MRKSETSVDVVVRDFGLNPRCPHGPTVLFSSGNGEKFFSCAGLRSRECFYLDFSAFNQDDIEQHSRDFVRTSGPRALSYKEVTKSSPDERIFCKACGIFVPALHFHESHEYVRGIDDKALIEPSLFLPQLDDNKLNAQYFFDDNTLDFIVAMLESLKLDKVVCIGAPRLHDFIRSRKPSMSSLLLDIDGRFKSFNEDSIFIRYNMFNNHFFEGPQDEEKLKKFLKDDGQHRTRHCVFSDPPFAARTELLDFNFRKFVKLFREVNSSHKVLPIFLVFPYFNEPHIKRFMPEMEMMDFQVSYMNHKAYRDDFKGRKEGSPVRLFTNVDLGMIRYPKRFDKYRFCLKCRRFASITNKHCGVCGTCPSKNGATYRHCKLCIHCVKPNYVHCQKCQRCVSKSTHNCVEYQKHQSCWFCDQNGHVEAHCEFMKKFKRRKDGSCIVCGEKHNLRNCTKRSKLK